MIFIAIALIGILTLIEPRTGWWERLRNMQVWGVRLALSYLPIPALSAIGAPSLIDGAKLPFLLGFAAYLVVMDLGEYLFHRAQHAFPWMWAMHSLHHSDPIMNATTTERHFWGDQFLKALTIWPLAYFLVKPSAPIFVAYYALSLWNYVAHADIRLSFGRWSWLLNSPAYHQRHHSRLTEHYNSNYAALLPIWDVMLGSYHRPHGHPPTGLDRAPKSLREALTWPFCGSAV